MISVAFLGDDALTGFDAFTHGKVSGVGACFHYRHTDWRKKPSCLPLC